MNLTDEERKEIERMEAEEKARNDALAANKSKAAEIKAHYGPKGKYVCTNCKRAFERTKNEKNVDPVRATILTALFLVLAVFCFLGGGIGWGVSILVILALGWGFVMLSFKLFGKQVCPHCNSRTFIKN